MRKYSSCVAHRYASSNSRPRRRYSWFSGIGRIHRGLITRSIDLVPGGQFVEIVTGVNYLGRSASIILAGEVSFVEFNCYRFKKRRPCVRWRHARLACSHQKSTDIAVIEFRQSSENASQFPHRPCDTKKLPVGDPSNGFCCAVQSLAPNFRFRPRADSDTDYFT